MIYLLINNDDQITGWTLTQEFAELNCAANERVELISNER